MATKLIHCKTYSTFNSKKLSALVENTSYTVGVGGGITKGTPEINYLDIVFIKDTRLIWTHGCLYGVPYDNSDLSYSVNNLTITDYIESPNGEFLIKSDGYALFKQLQSEYIGSDLFDGPATALTSKSIGSTTNPVYFNSAGVPKACGYSLSKSVPADALFTDSKVTSVGNHYDPSANTASELSVDASSTTAATWNTTSIVTGVNLQRDAKGHVVGVTVDSVKMPANPNSDTKNTTGSSDTSSKIFLVGATTLAANPVTYSHDTAYVGTDGCLYSGGLKVLTSITDSTNTTNSNIAASATAVKSAYDKAAYALDVANTKTSNTGTVTSVTLSSGTGISVTDSGKAITTSGTRTISLNEATTSALGGIKIAKDNADYTVATNTSPTINANVTSAGNYYGIEIDSTGKAYTYIPTVTASVLGLMSKEDKVKLDSIESGADSIVIGTEQTGGKTTASFTINGGTATTFDIYGITNDYNPTSASSTYSLSQLGAKNLYNAVLSKSGGTMDEDAIINNANGNLYIGDENNLNWVTFSDILGWPTDSSGNINTNGSSNWNIYVDGKASFKSISLDECSMNPGATISVLYKDANNYGGLVFKGSTSDGLPAHLYKNTTSSNELTLNGGLLVTNLLRLKGSEAWSDFISSVYNSDGSITNNATLSNLSCIKHALNFAWYTDSWQIGSVRAGDSTSLGFGITLGNTSLKLLVGKTAVNIYDSLVVSGSLSAESGNFYTKPSGAYWSSDRRLKDNISSARNLNIDSLIREFDWKDTGNHSWGFIAQELKEILPEAVNYDELIDRYSVNYDVAHSAAIASLSAKIELLESRIKELEK